MTTYSLTITKGTYAHQWNFTVSGKEQEHETAILAMAAGLRVRGYQTTVSRTTEKQEVIL